MICFASFWRTTRRARSLRPGTAAAASIRTTTRKVSGRSPRRRRCASGPSRRPLAWPPAQFAAEDGRPGPNLAPKRPSCKRCAVFWMTPALHWLDATVALSGERLSFPQLLGTGGNDGRLDFTNNFMRRLVADRDGLFRCGHGRTAAGLQAASASGAAGRRGAGSACVLAGPVRTGLGGRSERQRRVRRQRTHQSMGLRAGTGGSDPVRRCRHPPPPGRSRERRQLSIHRTSDCRWLGRRRRSRSDQRTCRVLGAVVGSPRRLR